MQVCQLYATISSVQALTVIDKNPYQKPTPKLLSRSCSKSSISCDTISYPSIFLLKMQMRQTLFSTPRRVNSYRYAFFFNLTKLRIIDTRAACGVFSSEKFHIDQADRLPCRPLARNRYG